MFITMLGQLGKRSVVSELDEKLAHITQQVRVTGKPGKLTLTLTIKPLDSEATRVDVIEKITAQVPEVGRKPSLFFTTETGQLLRTDPSQIEMKLEEIPGGKPESDTQQKAPVAVAQ